MRRATTVPINNDRYEFLYCSQLCMSASGTGRRYTVRMGTRKEFLYSAGNKIINLTTYRIDSQIEVGQKDSNPFTHILKYIYYLQYFANFSK